MILVLIAALLHASWNTLVKMGGEPEFTIAAYQLMGGIICLCFVPFVQLLTGSGTGRGSCKQSRQIFDPLPYQIYSGE